MKNQEMVLTLIETLESQLRLLKAVCTNVNRNEVTPELPREWTDNGSTGAVAKMPHEDTVSVKYKALPPSLIGKNLRKQRNVNYSIPAIYEYMIEHSKKGVIPSPKQTAQAFNISLGLYHIIKNRFIKQGKLKSVKKGVLILPHIALADSVTDSNS